MLIPPRTYNTTVVLNGETKVDTTQRGDAVYEEFDFASLELFDRDGEQVYSGNVANRDENVWNVIVEPATWVISGDTESYSTAAELTESELPHTETVETLFNTYSFNDNFEYEYEIDISVTFNDAAASFEILVDGSAVRSETVNANGGVKSTVYQDTGSLATYSDSVPVKVSLTESSETTSGGTISITYSVGSKLSTKIKSVNITNMNE